MGCSTIKKMGIHHENWGIKNEDLTINRDLMGLNGDIMRYTVR
jgi:hypothetical protein